MTKVTTTRLEVVQGWKKGCCGPRRTSHARWPVFWATGKIVTSLHAVKLWNIVPPIEELFLALDQAAVERFWPAPPMMPVMVDSVAFATKPNGTETGGVSKRILKSRRQLNQIQFAEVIISGHTVIPAGLHPGIDPKTGTLSSTHAHAVLDAKNLWLLDIDNKDPNVRLMDVLRACHAAGLQPFLIYESFRSGEVGALRWRVCIESDVAVTDPGLVRRINQGMIEALIREGMPDMDNFCIVHNWLFYSGKRVAWMASRMVTSLERLRALAVVEELVQQPAVSVVPSRHLVPAIHIPAVGNRSIAQVSDVTRCTTLQVEAIRRGDVAGLRSLILAAIPFEETVNQDLTISRVTVYSKGQGEPVHPLAMSERIPAICSFPLGLLLGVLSDGTMFRCLLHDDKTPSAHIKQVPDGRYRGQYRYKCFGHCVSERALSALDIVEELQGTGTYKAFKFLEDLLGIGDSSWMIQRKQELDVYEGYIRDGQLESSFPILHRELDNSNALPVMLLHLHEARRHLVDRTESGYDDLIYFRSLRDLSSDLIEQGTTTGAKLSSVAKKTDYVTHLGLVNKLQDSNIPSPLLQESRRHQNLTGNRYRIGYYRFIPFSRQQFTRAEQIITSDKERGFRRGAGFGREAELVLNGKTGADRTRPQDLGRGIGNKSLDFYDIYHAAASAQIAAWGWTTEIDIKSAFKGMTDRKFRELSKTWMPKLLADTGTRHVKLTKINRAQYGIPQSVHDGCKIIIPIN